MDRAKIPVEKILIIAFIYNVFSGFNRERKTNIEYDGGVNPCDA